MSEDSASCGFRVVEKVSFGSLAFAGKNYVSPSALHSPRVPASQATSKREKPYEYNSIVVPLKGLKGPEVASYRAPLLEDGRSPVPFANV